LLPGVALVHHSEAFGLIRGGADVVHRPYQINNPGDLTFLASLGERLIVTNQDLISYHNPSYFKDAISWHGYRRLTRLALAVADHVIFFSAHARDDALAEDLVEPSRATVVGNGVDHPLADGREPEVPPRGAGKLPESAEAILCIGTDFRHKNRIFALRMLEQLKRRHDWAGYLLFAGPTVPHGSSSFEEAELLALHPWLAHSLIDFGAVGEAEKAWLFGRVGLVVYPTIYEGFGLVPFEAAHHRVPCMWAAGTSLREMLPDGTAEIVAWNAEQSADRALELLRDDRVREHHVAAIRTAGRELTWDATAARLLELYDAVCDAPVTPANALERRHGVIEGALSEDAMRLIGPGGALPADIERPLLALATHPQLGATVFGALKLGYRASYKLRQWGGRRAGGRRS
jgi:glycosyltransferase involved in cell wall biosynthesis